MAPRATPPDTLPMLSAIYVAPKFRPLLASPSCHSLNHFGASHSAALSSLAPASAPLLAMPGANTRQAAIPNKGAARGKTLAMILGTTAAIYGTPPAHYHRN